ncbi:MAG: thioredoxin family protein [Ardenticatenales bacterium]|nr:thioredoxin family protein [Ardenticatenales bacterium]
MTRSRRSVAPHTVFVLSWSLTLALATTACNADPTPSDPAAIDAATSEALQQTAVETADALSKLDSAPAPTSALAGTQIALAATAAISSPTGAYVPTGGASDPAAVLAAAEGRVGKPVAVWFWAEDCAGCDEIGAAWDALRAANEDRVVFARVDVADPAAADAVLRYRIAEAPAFVVFASDGRPVASVAEWPGAEVFAGYLTQAK